MICYEIELAVVGFVKKSAKLINNIIKGQHFNNPHPPTQRQSHKGSSPHLMFKLLTKLVDYLPGIIFPLVWSVSLGFAMNWWNNRVFLFIFISHISLILFLFVFSRRQRSSEKSNNTAPTSCNTIDNCESPIEEIFWEVAKHELTGLTPQFQINSYRVDFALPDYKIVIELDGHEYHQSKPQRTSDYQRQRALQ